MSEDQTDGPQIKKLPVLGKQLTGISWVVSVLQLHLLPPVLTRATAYEDEALWGNRSYQTHTLAFQFNIMATLGRKVDREERVMFIITI